MSRTRSVDDASGKKTGAQVLNKMGNSSGSNLLIVHIQILYPIIISCLITRFIIVQFSITLFRSRCLIMNSLE